MTKDEKYATITLILNLPQNNRVKRNLFQIQTRGKREEGKKQDNTKTKQGHQMECLYITPKVLKKYLQLSSVGFKGTTK